MSKLKATTKQNPPRELIAKATDAWTLKAKANFCSNLETARALWRRYRSLVEAPDYPSDLLEAFKEEHDGELPDDNGSYAGEEIFSPQFKKDCLARGTQTAADWRAQTTNEPKPALCLSMTHDPGIRVYGLDEEPDFISVTKEQAQQIRRLAKLVFDEGAPAPGPWPDEIRDAGKARVAAYAKAADDLDSLPERVRKLSQDDIQSVQALIDLLEFGDGGIEHGSWVRSIVRELLWHVAFRGPGPANELPFGRTLLGQVVAYDYFESWINDARWLAKRYPGLLKNITVQSEPMPNKGATA